MAQHEDLMGKQENWDSDPQKLHRCQVGFLAHL